MNIFYVFKLLKHKDVQIQNNLIYEGITGFAYGSSQAETIPMYQLHKNWAITENANNGDHFYTISEYEKDNSINSYGFTDDGILAYVSETGENTYLPFHPSQISLGDGLNALNGNFQNYSKSSFYISSIGIDLVFEHVYNSMALFLHSSLMPLGPGWSHSYHSYIDFTYKINAIEAVWPDGNIDEYQESSGSYSPVYKFVYDEFTEISDTKFEIKKKNQIVYTYEKLSGSADDSLAMLTSITDRNGNTLTCNYETGGNRRLISITGPAGRHLTITYYSDPEKPGNNGLIKEVKDESFNRIIRFEYNDNGQLSKFIDVMGRTTQYEYASGIYDHLLHQITLPEENVIKNTYIQRKINSQSKTGTGTLTFDFSASPITVTNAENIKIDIFKTNFGGLLLPDKIRDELGNEIDPEFTDPDHPGKPIQLTDANGKITTYVYDTKGNVTEINQPMGVTHKFDYNANNDPVSYTDPRNKETDFTYDGNGNLTLISDPLSHTVNIGRKSNGLIESITNPMSHTTNFTHDQYGNVLTVQDPLSHTTTFVYDIISRMTEQTNAINQQKTYSYYNNDLINTITNAASGITTYGYDKNDNLTSITNPNSQTTNWGYDDQDLLISISNPLSHQKSYDHYEDGRLKTKTNPDGEPTSYSYDNAGRLTGFSSSSVTASLGYDGNGNITSATSNGHGLSITYDDLNRIDYYTDGFGNMVDYGYDAAGNVISITYPGNKTVTYTYYDDNRLWSVKDWHDQTTSYTYRADGTLSQIQYGNNVLCNYSYDGADRLTGISITKSGSEMIASYSYTLDEIGNITNVDATEPLEMPIPDAKDISLIYDIADRIQSAGSNNYTFNRDFYG